MKTLYCMAIYDSNGDIKHCVTSDAPLPDKPLVKANGLVSYEHFTTECADGDFVRAKDLLPALHVVNDSIAIKKGMAADRVTNAIKINPKKAIR